MELTCLLHASWRFRYSFVFYMPTGKMAYLTRGPFPVSFESQSLHLSVYSKFRRFFFVLSAQQECNDGRGNWILFSFLQQQQSRLLHLNHCHLCKCAEDRKTAQLSKRLQVLKSAGQQKYKYWPDFVCQSFDTSKDACREMSISFSDPSLITQSRE